jgi:AcrR family transcriptional regulator
MARPVNANAQQTKHRILEAASKLFAEHGYEGTSVRQIASGASVSLGMIRHYFGSKEGLYRACIESVLAIFGELGSQIARGVAAGDKPAEVVSQMVRTGFAWACEHRSVCKLMLWDLMRRDRWRSKMGDSSMLPFVLATGRAVAGPLGRPAAEMALVTRTLIFLIVRYATADHDEVAYLLSDGTKDATADDTTVNALEEHLVDVAVRLYM